VARTTATVTDPGTLPAFESSSVYERIREDIIQRRLGASERLKVNVLAARYGTSTNPIREALQQLRGEGLVVFSRNRGARVRTVDEDFVRDIYEVEVLFEPYLTRWFVGLVTAADVQRLEEIQAEIEDLNFGDTTVNSVLHTKFHWVLYHRHYNRHVVEMWWQHREILTAMSRDFPIALGRQAAVLREHRQLIACLKAQDADGAAKVVATHVEGSGRHLIEHMRAARTKSDAALLAGSSQWSDRHLLASAPR